MTEFEQMWINTIDGLANDPFALMFFVVVFGALLIAILIGISNVVNVLYQQIRVIFDKKHIRTRDIFGKKIEMSTYGPYCFDIKTIDDYTLRYNMWGFQKELTDELKEKIKNHERKKWMNELEEQIKKEESQ